LHLVSLPLQRLGFLLAKVSDTTGVPVGTHQPRNPLDQGNVLLGARPFTEFHIVATKHLRQITISETPPPYFLLGSSAGLA
jgi:hypothetical protein